MRALVALVVLVVGCGDVSMVQLGPEGGADVVTEAHHAEASPSEMDAGSASEALPSGPSCNVDERCAPCAPYPCAAVIACVRSGDGGAYPWLNCHNTVAGVGASVDGMNCAMRAACP